MVNFPYVTACPIDESSVFTHSNLQVAEGPLRKCVNCGQLVSSCTDHEYDSSMQEFDVPEGTYPHEAARARAAKLYRMRLEKISKLLGKDPQQLNLLDVGASSGSFLEVAKDYGFQCYGVEPAKQAAQAARERGLNVFAGNLEEASFTEMFDVITMFEVIEHLKNPKDLLKECYRRLKPKGVLLIGTGNTDSWTVKVLKSKWNYFHMEKHGGHISFFSVARMKRLAIDCGFNVHSIETRNVRFAEKYCTNKVVYRLLKIGSELLNYPARIFNQGHDMLAFLRKL